jgi:hypothetical protein
MKQIRQAFLNLKNTSREKSKPDIRSSVINKRLFHVFESWWGWYSSVDYLLGGSRGTFVL